MKLVNGVRSSSFTASVEKLIELKSRLVSNKIGLLNSKLTTGNHDFIYLLLFVNQIDQGPFKLGFKKKKNTHGPIIKATSQKSPFNNFAR